MRLTTRILALALGLITGAVQAQQSATVVELFTSQGCSSCPPADAMLAQLAERDDVIALALHVDYWDYIGWVDDLADPAFTRRQQAYARRAGVKTIYTPQMVIGGVDHVVGSRPMAVMDRVQAHNATVNPVDVRLTRAGSELVIQATAREGVPRTALVQVVRYTPRVSRDITRGENAGKTIIYANVVTEWAGAGEWNTARPLDLRTRLAGSDPVVVIIQDGADGPVLGAAQLR